MKIKNMFWAALSMTAALVMTACSSDDNMMTPAAPQAEVKTIPYSVTVNEGAATNRATVADDMKTLKFAAGDKLYVIGSNISGTLTLKSSDAGKSSGATFEGDLTYTGSDDSPASDLQLAAVLVGTNNKGVNIDGTGISVSYPKNAYCADVNEAVEKYSFLMGTSTYGDKSFTLSQNTAFLNFEITFEDGTATGTELSAVVSNNGSDIATANVTTTTVGGKVVAKFVLPVMSSATTLSGATVKMGDKAALTINDASLTGKVYNVKKTYAAAAPTAYTLAESTVGMIVGSDGKAYAAADKDNLPTGVTAVAMVAYKSATVNESLAIQLNGSSEKMNWANAKTYANGLNTSIKISGGTWRLPLKEDWQNMFVGCAVSGDATVPDANNEMDPIAGFKAKIAATGITWQSSNYWASTESGSDVWLVGVKLDGSNALAAFMELSPSMPVSLYVRACLAF